MENKLPLSIVIVTHNSVEYIQRCLVSFQIFLQKVPHEICIVDNASEDNIEGYLKNKFPSFQLIQNKTNVGFAAAVNQGIRATTGTYILCMNPDAELMNTGFMDLIYWMDQNPKIGIIGPKILNTDRTLQLSCRSFPSYETALFNRYSILTRLFPKNAYSQKYLKNDWDHNSQSQADWVSGACFLLRRSMLEQIGLMDEAFFMYCEDVDLCKRAGNAGWQVLYHPGAQVLHHIGGSSRRMKRRMIKEHHRSMWHYYQKYYTRNFFKDSIVASAIFGRCAFQLLLPPKIHE